MDRARPRSVGDPPSGTVRRAGGSALALAGLEPGALKEAARMRGEPEWLQSLRARRFETYRQSGLPSPVDEAWRGSDLRLLVLPRLPILFPPEGEGPGPMVRLEGIEKDGGRAGVSPLFSRLLDAAAGMGSREGSRLFNGHEAGTAPGLVAMNAALVQDGAFLHVPRAVEGSAPYRVRVHPSGWEGMVLSRNVVQVQEAGRATFIEEYAAPRRSAPVFSNSVTEVRVGRGASLDVLTLIRWEDGISCCHRAVARIAEGGRLRWYLGTVGGALVRVDVEAYLEGPEAESYIVGIGVGDGGRRLDHRTVQDHCTGDTRSRIHFGTLLKGGSRSIYRGLIRMEEGALRSDAYQKNDNLILERGSEARAIPMLEILTDDVKCSHGSTVGRVSREDLFYLASRGIPEAAARNLIADGFIRRQLSSAGEWNPLAEELHGVLREHALGLDGER